LLTIYDPGAHVKKKKKTTTTISTISPISIKPIKSVGMQLTFIAVARCCCCRLIQLIKPTRQLKFAVFIIQKHLFSTPLFENLLFGGSVILIFEFFLF